MPSLMATTSALARTTFAPKFKIVGNHFYVGKVSGKKEKEERKKKEK